MASVFYVDSANAESPAASGQDDVILPGFIERRPDGIFIDTGKLASADEFQRVVDRVFASGCYFSGLDYAAFQRLLYDFDPSRAAFQLRLADEISQFPAERRALYKGIKIVGSEAQYIFEPVLLEKTIDEPVYAAGEDGERRVIGTESKVVAEKAHLDVDEFIADMWGKGMRFGIDVDAVRAAIRDERCERLVVARERAPTEGHDAGIEEQTPELHRDNAPREMPNGRIDLGQYKNRFPQMREGARLLLKTPRVLGKAGRTIAGKLVEPPMPKDFDLSSLAGEGTRIENHGGRDYIVAAMDGFLNLDTKTNRISITEKIINREGVSSRTTGNLALTGDQYEEFGEVQEGRMVEGRSLTFHADVFGKAVSIGGKIVLEHNLVGGTALNRAGDIEVAGLASSAVVQTASGVLRLKRAENCVLIGDRVEVEWASRCTVLAEEVEIAAAEGCAIAGKRIHLGMARAKSEEETLVSVLLPDLSGIEGAEEKERAYLAECEELIANLKHGIEHVTSQPEMRQYLTIAGKIHRKEITLTAEQQGQWEQMRARMGPTLKRITQGREDIKALEDEIASVHERIAALGADKEKAGAGLECRVDSVLGDVTVRTMVVPLDETPLPRLPHRELIQRLRGPDAGSRRLFAGDDGQFAWKPEPAAQ